MMWIATPYGFFSAVNDKEDLSGETLQVRTRARADAEYLRDWLLSEHGAVVSILRWERRDYPWRLLVTKDQWGSFLVYAAESIDYTNFKDRVKKVNPARATVYGRAWSVFYEIENEDGAQKRKPVAWSYPAATADLDERTLADLMAEPEVDTVSVINLDGQEVGRRSIHDLTDAEFIEFEGMGSLMIDSHKPAKKERKRNKKRRR